MKLTIAGRDRTQDLGPELAKAAEGRKADRFAPSFCSPEHSALSLRTAKDEDEYLARALNLMLLRTGLRVNEFVSAPYDGIYKRMLQRVRRVIWRVIRYQPESLVFHQNTINMQLTGAMEFLRDEQAREMDRLRQRVDELERKLSARADEKP